MCSSRTWCARGVTMLALVLAGCGGARAVGPGDAAVDAVGLDAAGGARPRLLFVGNSYLYTHDVPAQVGALTAAARVEQATPGGYTLAQHAADAGTDGTPLAAWLRTGLTDANRFDAVVLQEQSQLGGFPLAHGWFDARLASLTGAAALGELAAGRGATVVLYQTWGRVDGDPANAAIFGTYRAMQDQLDDGYLLMAEHLRARGVPTRVAPVGAAFRRVFDDDAATGADPLAASSEFRALYEPDGSHPSARGAYLAACVLSATITGADPRGFADGPELPAPVAARLRAACAAAVDQPRWRGPVQAVEAPRVYAAPRGDQANWGRYDLAVSDDGDRVLIAPSRGEARVLVRSAAGWAVEAVLPLPAGVAVAALALSADGGVAALGDPVAGAAYLFGRVDGAWAALGPLASPTDAGLGRSIALSADGARVLAAGAEAVHAFVAAGGGWTEEPGIPVPGATVAATGDGARALVVGAGPPAVWRRDADGWVAEATLGSDGGGVPAIDRAGARAAVLRGTGAGATVAFYARTQQAWAADGTLTGFEGAWAALAMAPDGARVVVGAPERPAPLGVGAAWTCARSDGAWRREALVVQADQLDTFTQARGLGTACALAGPRLWCTERGSVGVPAWQGGVREFRLP
ncbi:MAG: hypothetical protein R3B06_05560 [Kofleriaceae bacterium]